jgi:hypothetical protein
MMWRKEELRRIDEADDLHIAPFREDGATLGTPTWIWSVSVDGDLYARGYNGQASRWYQDRPSPEGRPDHCGGRDARRHLRPDRGHDQ